jgi:acetyl esterase/lipase
MTHRYLICLLLILTQTPGLQAQNNGNTPLSYNTKTDLIYLDSTVTPMTDYARERCRLDIYYPENVEDFPTVVWFHGGGIQAGNKFIPEELKKQGIAVVAANYRLNPKVKAPVYIEDAAAAIAWTMKHISEFGGDPKKVFISGHSAGGYLATMVGMDTTYLQKHDLRANDLAGIISYSGHAITHFTIRTEMGMDWNDPLVDNYAPLSHMRKDMPPLVLILGDRNLELYGRYEEVAYLWRMMQLIGHPYTRIYELDGYSHGAMAVPAHHILLENMREILGKK